MGAGRGRARRSGAAGRARVISVSRCSAAQFELGARSLRVVATVVISSRVRARVINVVSLSSVSVVLSRARPYTLSSSASLAPLSRSARPSVCPFVRTEWRRIAVTGSNFEKRVSPHARTHVRCFVSAAASEMRRWTTVPTAAAAGSPLVPVS